MQCWKRLSSQCNFAVVTADQRSELRCNKRRSHSRNYITILLESNNLTLQHVFNKARLLEAQRNAEEITGTCLSVTQGFSKAAVINATVSETKEQCFTIDEENLAAAREKCSFCGNNKHAQKLCPARDAVCYKCQKKGRFVKICRSKPRSTDETSAALHLK